MVSEAAALVRAQKKVGSVGRDTAARIGSSVGHAAETVSPSLVVPEKLLPPLRNMERELPDRPQMRSRLHTTQRPMLHRAQPTLFRMPPSPCHAGNRHEVG